MGCCGLRIAVQACSLSYVRLLLFSAAAAMILFQSWVPTSAGAYIASCLAVLAMALAAAALKGYRLLLEARWAAAAQRAAAAAAAATTAFSNPGACVHGVCVCVEGEFTEQLSMILTKGPFCSATAAFGSGGRMSSLGEKELRCSTTSLGRSSSLAGSGGTEAAAAAAASARPCAAGCACFLSRAQLARNMVRSGLTGAVTSLEYLLVLVAVTFNLGLVVSAVLGFCLGALLFGERSAVHACPATRVHFEC